MRIFRSSGNSAILFDRRASLYFIGPPDETRAAPIIKPIKAAIATRASPYGFLSASLSLSSLVLEKTSDGADGD